MFLVLSDLFLHHSLGSFLKSLACLPWLPIHSPSGTGAIPTLVELSLNAKRPETASEVSCDQPSLDFSSYCLNNHPIPQLLRFQM